MAVGSDLPVVAMGNKMDVTPMLECVGITWVNFKEDAFVEIDSITDDFYLNDLGDDENYE